MQKEWQLLNVAAGLEEMDHEGKTRRADNLEAKVMRQLERWS